MPKVHGASLSPFVRKVLIFLEHKGVAYEHDPIVPINVSAEYKTKSPLGKVPCYEDEDVLVPDSSVICRYIEDVYPSPAMYPAQPAARARACWYEEYADTRLLEVLGPPLVLEVLVKPRFLNQPTDQARVDDNMKNGIPPELDYLEGEVPDSGFMLGDDLGIADVAIGSLFLNARYANFEVDARRWPRLASYVTRVLDHPAFVRRAAVDAETLRGP